MLEFISATTAWVVWIKARVFRAMTRSNSAMVISMAALLSAPAQLTNRGMVSIARARAYRARVPRLAPRSVQLKV